MSDFKAVALKAISSNFLNSFFTILTGLILVKVIIHFAGTEIYGVYTLVMAVAGFSGMVELGIGSSIARYVSQYRDSDAVLTSQYLVTSITILGTLGAIGGCIMFVFSFSSDLSLIGIDDSHIVLAQSLLRVSSLNFLSLLLLSSFSAVLQAYFLFTTLNYIQISKSIVTVVAAYLILSNNLGFVLFFQTIAIINIITLIIIISIVMRLDGVKVHSSMFETKLLKSILGFSSLIFINNLFSSAYYQIDKFVVSNHVGAINLPYYSVPFGVSTYILSVAGTLMNFVFPYASKINGLSDRKEMASIYSKSMKLGIIVATILCCVALLGGMIYLKYWIGGDFFEKSYIQMSILPFVFYFSAIGMVPYHFYNGMGKPQINLISSIAGSILFVLTMLYTVKLWGSIGVCISFFMGIAPFPIYFNFLHKELAISNTLVWSQIFAGLGVCVIFMVVIQQFFL